jgi:iron complex transport system substrate-binding protein
MKAVSLLPSATEIVFALGAQDLLCGVSCDCDYPEEALRKPVVSSTALPIEHTSTPQSIDQLVREQLEDSASIYSLNTSLIRDLRPDLILAQDLCRVCAVPSGDVKEALDVIGCRADVISLDPHTINEVIDGVQRVGDALGKSDQARILADNLRNRVDAVRRTTKGLRRRRVFALEWPDPPFCGGHWVPEMVEVAGGHDVVGVARAPSREVSWGEIVSAAPEVIVCMPCGFGLADAAAQARVLYANDAFLQTPAAMHGDIFAVDASSYFSRPGPRLIDGVEILSGLLHPRDFSVPPVSTALRVEGPELGQHIAEK